MSLTNVSKPTTTISNASRVTSTFANQSEPSFTPLWSASILPWQLDAPWETYSEITNSSRVS